MTIEDSIYFAPGFGSSTFAQLKGLLFPSGTVGPMFIPGHPDMIAANTLGSTVATLIDFSGNAKNATQSTDGNRGRYGRVPKSGRRNILTQTATLSTQTKTTTNVQHTLSFRGTGDIELSGTHADTIVGTGVNDIVSLTFTPTAGSLTLTVDGDVYDAQLEIGASRSTYQLVADANGYDITEAGSANCYYIQLDGTDDSYQTATIDYTGTDEVTCLYSIRRLSISAVQVLYEFGSDFNSGRAWAGSIQTSGRYEQNSCTLASTAYNGYQSSVYATQHTAILTAMYDISGTTRDTENIYNRVNGSNDKSTTTGLYSNQTVNWENKVLNLFRRNNTSLPFNGQFFFGAFPGRNYTLAQIQQAESLISRLTPGVSL